ncbi:MAG: phage tail tube protein, partial [Desulfobacteraceae bacterium]|nr:phage tail tube protein [Desulfobacteraceae bacterium]
MAWQKGSTASIMLGFEATATYGTAATAGYVLPVNYGESLVGTQPINSVNTIRGNRNPNQGFRGARSVSGQIPVPVDSVCLPYWLAATFGDPTTTGSTSPYVHEYKIANTQPSFTLEKAFTDLDTSRYLRFLGCKMGGFSIEVGGDGELVMNFDVAGAQDSWGTSAFDSSPTSPSLTRINMFDGAVVEGGTTSTIVTAVSLNVNLGLDTRPETISIGSS